MDVRIEKFDRIPDKLKEKIFERLFEVAEVAKFTKEELMSYEDSLKYYRDLKNSFDTARLEGIEFGIGQGTETTKKEIILEGAKQGMSITQLALLTKYTEEQVKQVIRNG